MYISKNVQSPNPSQGKGHLGRFGRAALQSREKKKKKKKTLVRRFELMHIYYQNFQKLQIYSISTNII